jgi:signal transduction histidine kinase
MPRFGGVRLRATAAAVLTVSVALGVASAALLIVLQGSLETSARAEAAGKAKAAASAVKVDEPGAPPGATTAAGRGADVQVLTTTSDGPRWKSGSGYVVAAEQVDTEGKSVLVQGRSSLAPTRQAIASLRSLLLPGVPALLLLVALLTWLAVGRALKPVSAIRGKLADITAHDLHQRVPEPGSRDEIAALARTVNATLDRLQTAVEQHKRFVADAAHELRSPLAVLRTRLELAGTEAEALTDVQRIQTLTADLLLLARLDAGEPPRDQEVDLGQVVAEEAARPRPRPEVTVELDIAADVLVRGSAGRLTRLTANLVDNAVRHAATTVTVRLTADGASATLEVTDDGPGIPRQHHEVVFDRFTRLDQARARDHGGSGLGLAIARDIAVAHHGSLTVVPDHSTGACLRTVLPLTQDRPRVSR